MSEPSLRNTACGRRIQAGHNVSTTCVRPAGHAGECSPSEPSLRSTTTPRAEHVSALADRWLDAVTVGMGEFTTEDLLAVAEYRERISPECWSARMIREYVECWRGV